MTFEAHAAGAVVIGIIVAAYVWHRWRESQCRPDCDDE